MHFVNAKGILNGNDGYCGMNIYRGCTHGCFYCDSTDYFSTLGIMIGMFAGILFEERFVGFEDAKTMPERILRLAGGIALFGILHVALKLPFPADMLAGTDAAGMFLRVFRHAVEVFLIVGPYTALFRYIKANRKEAV